MLLLGVLQGGDPIPDLIGIAAGHTYIYVRMVLPTSHGYRLLNYLHPKAAQAISIFESYFPQGRPRSNVWGAGGSRVDTRDPTDR